MLSMLATTQEQSSSTKEKVMRKSKPTIRHPTTRYPISTATIPENGVATRQHLLLNQNRRRRILLTRKSIQDASYTPKESTRTSNATPFEKHSEHLQLLPTKTSKRRSTRAIHHSSEESSMPESHLLGLPLVLHPIKTRMGSPEL